jgi:hypothetical protein
LHDAIQANVVSIVPADLARRASPFIVSFYALWDVAGIATPGITVSGAMCRHAWRKVQIFKDIDECSDIS